MNEIHKLKNKTKVVMSSMPHMESVSLGILIGAGGRYEKKSHCGISHFIEHMLFKGSKTRDASQLKQAIEGIGGQFNGFTAEEVTCYLVKVPARYMLLGVDILSDMVMNPNMLKKDVEKERHVICEEIKMYKDQPSYYVQELLSDIMWPGHPLGRPLSGDESVIKKMTRGILTQVHKKYYKPSNMSVVACGKLDKKALLNALRSKLSTDDKCEVPRYENFTVKQKTKCIRIHHKATEQTNLEIGFHCYGRSDKDRFVVNLLNIILGANMSSRLFEEMREKRGLCYDVSSSVKKYEDTGGFFIHAGVDNCKVEESVVTIMEQLKRLVIEAVCQEELNRAKEFYKGQLLLALESTGTRMLWLGDKVMTKEGIPEKKKMLRGIDSVSTEDIRRVASKIFCNERLNIALIGPRGKVNRKSLDKAIEL